jgi:hypothetical protein
MGTNVPTTYDSFASTRAAAFRRCHHGVMETATVHHLPTGRMLALDDQGIGLRATWHLERGFVNLSLWREDRCVETFHLSVGDSARLVGFLVDGLSEATSTLVAPPPSPPTGLFERARDLVRRFLPG